MKSQSANPMISFHGIPAVVMTFCSSLFSQPKQTVWRLVKDIGLKEQDNVLKQFLAE